ncbi:hypothetical protein GPECTOR_21g713 [Gonium pectorale]|uniref:MPN domain-containing protein n=1 Tax=Gonium pectorale TaxID=33097 RepID=A0A150GI45_GONPE|nr:hypothetical protein GPECTOR_21g713 [Gonium pectorale]|eukprot:KXZ49487.1 hypothetical protein GPECTOR_21g713 [Gonium pectorale]
MPAVGRGTRPKSLVEHLSEQAPTRAVNDIVGIGRYLMSARLLLNQAAEYRAIGNEEQLYVILLRFASLLVETIPQHRDFKASAPAYAEMKRELMSRHLPELERLKAGLRLRERTDQPAPHSTNRPADAVPLSASNLPQLDWAASGAAALSAPPPPSLQVDDLLEVMRGGPAAVPPPPPPTPGYGTPAGQPPAAFYDSAPGVTDPYALAAAASASLAAASASASPLDVPLPKYSLSYASSSGRHALFDTAAPGAGRPASLGAERPQLPRYPALEHPSSGSAPDAAAAAAMAAAAADLAALSVVPHPSAGPSLGPQEVSVISMPASTAGLPATCSHSASAPPPPPPPPSAPPAPASTASASPPPGGPKELAKRAQLRDVHVSVALMEEFLAYARANTSRGIESCGILAGKLLAGDSTFAITTLIIPKQQGTSDTVQALNEEEIFEAQFEREIYPLGWIHTHPTQTCFLSSVDVHTQARGGGGCGYQTMLDEAVAIVMAPSDRSKRCGIFRLSTPGGLKLVQKCPQRGFHTHPPPDTGQELYELCGHVFLNPRTKHEVLDLR